MIKGIGVSPGIICGKAFLMAEEEVCVIKRIVPKNEMRAEIFRFRKALVKTKNEMKATHKRVLKELGRKHARLFYAYLLILDDTLFTEDVVTRIKEGINAEFALQEILNKVTETFSHIDDEYLRERERDIVDVIKKLIHNLLGKERKALESIKTPVIVVAHNLSPSDTISMKEDRVIGFVTDIGGRTSHTAILARSLEIPAVIGLHDITQKIHTGDTIIIDGYEGIVIINPTKQVMENYEREKKKFEANDKELEKLRDLPATTTDNRTINLVANIEIPGEVKSVLSHGGNGIGLYRTEYLYLNRADLPGEEEQYESYKLVAKSMLPYSVIIRTIDLGGDKLAEQLRFAPERNPFLGLRAIRLCLKYPELFRTQLRAILRASTEGNLKIMYPMISGIEELRKANKALSEVKDDLRQKNIQFNENIEIGAMIEVPSAALCADVIADEVDFLSIGTNDLIQYTIAVDRVNENVSDLYDPMHLGVIRLLKFVIDSCNKAGKSVSMCGEMASDPRFMKILVGLGLQQLSMSPIAIPKVKQAIRSVSFTEAEEITGQLLAAHDRSSIEKILRKSLL
ncbi:MAG: phosphoenolpyruvate--protein phosphotransferase [Elusimicrobiota bacterium]